jgi:hypothetical protein
MIRVNPSYIGIFLGALLILFAFSLNQAHNQYYEAQSQYKESLKLATQLKSLKQLYSRRFSISTRAYPSVTKKTNGGKTTLTSKEITLQNLNSLMGKILNSTYRIESLQIKKLNDTKASFEMSIK